MKKLILNASKDYNCGYHDGYGDAIEKACEAYCKTCDTKECYEEGTCSWVKKFRKAME